MSDIRCSLYTQKVDELAKGSWTREDLETFGGILSGHHLGLVSGSCESDLRDYFYKLVGGYEKFGSSERGLNEAGYNYLQGQRQIEGSPYQRLFYHRVECFRDGCADIYDWQLQDVTASANKGEAFLGSFFGIAGGLVLWMAHNEMPAWGNRTASIVAIVGLALFADAAIGGFSPYTKPSLINRLWGHKQQAMR